MSRFLVIKLFVIAIISWIMPIYATNVQSFIMETSHFYDLHPEQRPLSERFSATVHSPPAPIVAPQSRPVRVSMLLFSPSTSPRNYSLLSAFKRRMAELKIDYRLDVFYSNHAYFDAKIYEQLQSSKADYLILTGLDLVQSRYIEKILRGGSPKIIFYGLATPLLHWQNHSPFMYIGFDQTKIIDTLASYLHRQLPMKANIAAFILDSGDLGDSRCNAFLDAMANEKRTIQFVKTMPNNKESAFKATQALLKDKSIDFVFSCTQNISDGVVAALKSSAPSAETKTNSWGQSDNEVANVIGHRVLVSALFIWDDLAIAVAEGIKGDIEGEVMPKLYIARASLMSTELDAESLNLMMEQAFHYSAVTL